MKIVDDLTNPTVGKGEPEGVVVRIRNNCVILPKQLMDDLDWSYEDDLDISVIDSCFDWGESKSMLLRNLTKEREELDN